MVLAVSKVPALSGVSPVLQPQASTHSMNKDHRECIGAVYRDDHGRWRPTHPAMGPARGAHALESRRLTAFADGLTGFMMLVPLKVLVIKAVLLLMMGPLALSGALLGWLGGRAVWRRRSVGREAQLRRIFGEIVALAAARGEADDDRGG